MARLILDTGALIAGVRGRVDMAAPADADDVALPAVAVAEYLAGTLLDDDDAGRAAAHRSFLEEVLQVVPVHDRAVTDQHAALLAHVWRTGGRRGAHDLIVVATARATSRIVLTTVEGARLRRPS